MVLLTYVMIVAYVIKAIAYVLYFKKDTKKQRKYIRHMSSFSSFSCWCVACDFQEITWLACETWHQQEKNWKKWSIISIACEASASASEIWKK